MRIFTDLRYSLVGVTLGSALIVTAAVAHVDVIKVNLELLRHIESNKIDDVISGFLLMIAGLVIDRVVASSRKSRDAEIEAQKVRTLKATMRTVQDIVNNFLNNLILFEMEAAGVMPQGSLDSLDRLIQETFLKLKAIGELEAVHEKQLAMGMGIDYPLPKVGCSASSLRRAGP